MAKSAQEKKEKVTKSNWKFYSSMEKLEQLFDEFESIAMHGATFNDKFGHNASIAYRLHPQQAAIHNKLMEFMPDGFFTSKSDLYRKIDMIGTKCLLNLLVSRNIVEPKTIDKYVVQLKRINEIARHEREESLNQQFEEQIRRIGQNDSENLGKAIEDLNDIKDKMLEFTRKRIA